jgi:hypothetical protein
MVGPKQRIRAARELWQKDLKEDAAALIFIATAGVSRMRRPREDGHSDRAAFTGFVCDEIVSITNGATCTPLRFPSTTQLPGIRTTENVPLEDIFYATWRCVMIHEARWPDEVYLTPTRTDSEYRTCIELPPDGRVGLPEEWILGLALAVESAIEVVLPDVDSFPVYCVLSGPVDDLGSNQFQFIDGQTKVPRVNVRNQQAIPLFSDEGAMKRFTEFCEIPDLFIGVLPDSQALRGFVERGDATDRFVFNTVPEERLPSSYSRESLLNQLSEIDGA